MTINVSSSAIRKSLSSLYRVFTGSYARECLTQLETLGYSKMPFPNVEQSTEGFMADYLLYSLLRKSEVGYFNKPVPSKDELESEAVSGFLSVEQRCKLFNVNGRIEIDPSSMSLAPEAVIHTAKRKIRKLLGAFDLNELADNIDFSNGASTRLRRTRSAVPVKFTGKPHVTRGAALLAVSTIWYNQAWRSYCQSRFGRESDPCTWVEVVKGSQYFTVPKTTTSLRGAAKEPELNMLLQKGIGNMIRRRLKRVRIDLNDQSYNQYLAACGSRTGALATIDLESASDSVSLRLVQDLIPHDWYRFICMTRSEIIEIGGRDHTLEKVSSMGNGFTFELESLIFWALTSAVVDLSMVEDRRIGVYGDDIICHSSVAQDVIGVLAYCGFKTNVEKTWVAGPFRESCGKHYHYGVDVTPFYAKGDLATLENRYHLVNQLNEWVYRYNSVASEPLNSSTHDYIFRQLLPKSTVVFIPPHLSSKAGLFPPSAETVPGLWFCLRRQEYRYRAFLPGWLEKAAPGRKRRWICGSRSKVLASTPSYLTWWLRSLTRDSPGESSSVPVVEERVVLRYVTRGTSMWNDCKVVLPKSSGIL